MKNPVFLTITLILAFCFQAYAQTCSPAPVGLVSWWSGDNNPLDSRSRNTLTEGSTYSSGNVGQAFSFSGSSLSYRYASGSNSLDVGTSASGFAIEAWIYPTSLSGQQPIINWYFGSPANGFNLWINRDATSGTNSGYLSANVPDTLGNDHFIGSTSSVININQQNHIAFTYNKTTGMGRLYVNGIQVQATNLGVFTPQTANSVIYVAGIFSDRFVGQIDELSLYNRPLPATEIQAIFNAGTAGKCKPSATVAPNNLAGFYSADGDTRDSVTALTGTTFGNVGYKSGKVGQSFNFDPAGGIDYVTYNSIGVFKGQSQATIEAWVRPLGAHEGAFGGLIFDERTSLSSFTRFGLYLNNSGNVVALGRTGELNVGSLLNSTSTIPNGQWSHVAATWDSVQGIRIYINGSLAGTLNASVGSFSNTNSSQSLISDPVYFFNGDIDEVSTYTQALTQDEITSIYNAGIAGKLKDKATPTGTNVVVNPNSDATVTFPNVTTAGITQQIPLNLSLFPALPSGSTTTGLTYDIETTAVYTGSPKVCFNLPSITTSSAFNNLRILHLESNIWFNRTDLASINFATKTICTNSGLPSLSPFAVVSGFIPTAATSSISGRIMTETGRGLSRTRLNLQNTETGETLYATTNNFGYFRFDDLPSGNFYILNVSRKGYQFEQQSFQLNEDLGGLNIVGTPNE